MTCALTSGEIWGSFEISADIDWTSSGPNSLKTWAETSGGSDIRSIAAFCLGLKLSGVEDAGVDMTIHLPVFTKPREAK